jgi:hypothetical protein
MMIDQSGRAQSILTAIKAPDGGSFDTFKYGKNVREMRPLMAQSAELMSELPTATDRITVLEGYDAMRPDTLQVIPEAAQFVRSLFDEGKPVAAICQSPWTLIDADGGPGRWQAGDEPQAGRPPCLQQGGHWDVREG